VRDLYVKRGRKKWNGTGKGSEKNRRHGGKWIAKSVYCFGLPLDTSRFREISLPNYVQKPGFIVAIDTSYISEDSKNAQGTVNPAEHTSG
jgi:hypothetical protein